MLPPGGCAAARPLGSAARRGVLPTGLDGTAANERRVDLLPPDAVHHSKPQSTRTHTREHRHPPDAKLDWGKASVSAAGRIAAAPWCPPWKPGRLGLWRGRLAWVAPPVLAPYILLVLAAGAASLFPGRACRGECRQVPRMPAVVSARLSGTTPGVVRLWPRGGLERVRPCMAMAGVAHNSVGVNGDG